MQNLCAQIGLALILALGGCSKPAGQSQVLTVPLIGSGYVSTYRHPIIKDSKCGGLSNLGDVDADGFDEILVVSPSLHYDSAIGTPVGWMQAISGKQGQVLWKLIGTNDGSGAGSEFGGHFHFDAAFVVDDIDGDSISDIYALEAYSKKRAAWISGKTGKLIHVGKLPESQYGMLVHQPMGIRQANAVREVVFLGKQKADRPFSLAVLSVPELSSLPEVSFTFSDPLKSGSGVHVLSTNLPDENDGQPEWLIETPAPDKDVNPGKRVCHWRVVCSQTFKELRSIRTEVPEVFAETRHALLKDGISPGHHAVIVCSATGGGTNGRLSSIRSVSLKDGSVIWSHSGNDIAGGAATFTIDQSGKRTELGNDVNFGSPVVIIGDLNGDQIQDVATTFGLGSKKIALFSGKDGTLIRIQETSSHNLSDSLVAVRRGDKTALAAIGTNSKSKKLELIVLE